MKGSDEKRSKSKPAMENDSDKSKKSAKKAKAKAPAKPRIKPSFYYVSSSEDEADILKDRFWKDLEDGKVDIFRTADLYSTVKAIGRTARPKSLAESDLQKSGIKSMNDEGTSKDVRQPKGRKSRKVAEKESKKGNVTASNKAERGKTRTRASRSLSNSRLRVNLGAKIDASDDEEDLADSDADADKISITKLRNRKKQAQALEKREELEEESDGDDTDDDQEDEEETDESESDDDDVRAKRKVGKKVVNKTLKTKSKGKDKGGIQSTDKKAGNYGKLQKRGKGDGKDGDDDEDEDGQDKDFSEEDEDLANKEVVKIKIAKADLREKMKDNSEKDEDDGDDDGNDDEEEGDESDNDSKNEMQKYSSAKGEKIKLNKDKAEEVEEEEEAGPDKRLKEPSSKIIIDSEVVRLHMEDTIDSVIAQSAEYWKMHHEDKDKRQEDNMTKAEDDDFQRRGNKRKLGDKNILGEKAHLKLMKFASNPIDYESAGSDGETKKARQNEKLVSDDIDFDGTNTTKGNSDYLGTEQKFTSSIEDDDEEEEEEEEETHNEESPVADEVTESVADNSDQNGTKSESDIPTRRTDSADEVEGKDIGPVDEAAEEEDNLDHLVFNLKTVEVIEPEEIVDAYSEWNIKALTNEDLSKAVKFNDFDLVQAMMRESQQFDLDQADTSGLTLTMIATQNYFMEIVELLVLNGADVNAKMKDGHTALTLACEKGLHCAVSVLLCLGASINSPLSNGDTPLMLAVKKNHFHVVRILLEHGVNIGVSSASDRHCLALARQLNYQPIVEILTTHKTQLSGELFQQISMALEGSAKISAPVFPVQCFRLCDGSRFVIEFRHELQPTQTNRGMLLFVGHGCGSASNVNVKLYGSCAVTKATLNNTALQPLNEDNFILTFCPLRDGHNELEILTVPLTCSNYKVHLIVGAFLVTLL